MNSPFCAWDIIQTFGSDSFITDYFPLFKGVVSKLFYRYEAALFLQESSKTLQEKGDVDSSKLFLEQVFREFKTYTDIVGLIVIHREFVKH